MVAAGRQSEKGLLRRRLPRRAEGKPPAAILCPRSGIELVQARDFALERRSYLFHLQLQTFPGVNLEISKTKLDRSNKSDGLRHILAQSASLKNAVASG